LDNTASVAAPLGYTDTDSSNDSALDSDTLTPNVDLAISKTDGSSSAVPGTGILYTITVTNTGPSDAPGSTVTDTFPAALTNVTWAWAAPRGGGGGGIGSGNSGDAVSLRGGGSLIYTVSATIASDATGT